MDPHPDLLDPALEAARLEALRRYRLPGAVPEPELAGLLRAAARATGVALATLNLLDDREQHQYVTVGFDGASCARPDSMCVVPLREGRPVLVEDAAADPRFAANPFVDGRLASVRAYASAPLRTPDGLALGTLCVFDTVPRAFSAEDRRVLEDLAAGVVALLERRRLAVEASEALGLQTEALRGVRAPVHGMLGLLDELAQEVRPDLARRVALARGSATVLLDLLAALDPAVQQAPAGSRRLRPVDLAAVLGDVVAVLAVPARRRGVELVLRSSGHVPARVLLDADALRRDLVGPISAALADASPGVLEVRLEGEPMGVAVGDTAVVAVRVAGRVLELSAQVARRAGAAALPLDGLRLLVADDDPVTRMLVSTVLEQQGAVVVQVDRGDLALQHALDGSWDALVLDHQMPGLAGAEVAVRLHDAGVRVPVVGLTGAGAQARRDCRSAGMTTVLSKPVDLDALSRVLQAS